MAAVYSMRRRWTWAIGSTLLAACTVPNPHLDGGSDDGTGSDTGGSTANAATGTGNGSSPTTSDTSGEASTSTSTGSTPTTDDPTATTSTTSTTTATSTGPEPTCPETHACVDPPPDDWSGPVAIASGPIEQQPDCGGAFATELAVAFSNLIAANAQCDCSCGAATGVTCNNAVLEYHGSDSACFGSPVSNETLTPGCNNITNRSSGTYWQIEPVEVSGGQCQPSSNHQVPDAGFTSVTTACGGPRDAGGCGEDLCILEPTLPFESSLCVFSEGDFACPPGYPDKTLLHLSFTDDRGCTDCDCTDPEGTCGGTSALRPSDDCTGQFGSATVPATANCTQAVDSVGSATWTPGAPDAMCSDTGGAPMGAAAPTEPVTFCCTTP